MEDLNKTQIILLSLLVSFVSSVAVSIMTYSLLSEEPLTVTQTVNRVVEKTIETVVQSPEKPEVVTKEVTVVVKEEDLIIDAITQNKESLVRIWSGAGGEKVFVGFGLILSKEGLIVTPKLSSSANLSYQATLNNETKVDLNVRPSSEHFSFFTIADLKDLTLKEVILGDSNILQLGQTIISIKGETNNLISVGRITSFTPPMEGEENTSSQFATFESDMGQGNSGSPAINLKGELVGFHALDGISFIPINILKAELTPQA